MQSSRQKSVVTRRGLVQTRSAMKIRAILLGLTAHTDNAMNHLNFALREPIPVICARHLPAAKETVNHRLVRAVTQILQITQNAYPAGSGGLALDLCVGIKDVCHSASGGR